MKDACLHIHLTCKLHVYHVTWEAGKLIETNTLIHRARLNGQEPASSQAEEIPGVCPVSESVGSRLRSLQLQRIKVAHTTNIVDLAQIAVLLRLLVTPLQGLSASERLQKFVFNYTFVK